MSIWNQNSLQTNAFESKSGLLTVDSKSVDNLDIVVLKQLISQGLRRIQAKFRLVTSDPRLALCQLRVVRDCLSLGIQINWDVEVEGEFDFQPLFHLLPPEAIAPDANHEILTRWRETYKYGSYYWRQGLNFLLVKDTRFPESSSRYTIDEPQLIDIIKRGSNPISLDSLQLEPDMLNLLINEGLLLHCNGYVLTLPYRVIKKPVPYNAI